MEKNILASGTGNNTFTQVNRVKDNPKKHTGKCTCCGYTNHSTEKCKYCNCVCHSCGSCGHLSKICNKKKEADKKSTESRKNRTSPDSKMEKVNVHSVRDEEDDDLFIRKLYSVRNVSPNISKPTMLTVNVYDIELQMELDNGADISCINDLLYYSKFSDCPLVPVSGIQLAYDNHSMQTLGYLIYKVMQRRIFVYL